MEIASRAMAYLSGEVKENFCKLNEKKKKSKIIWKDVLYQEFTNYGPWAELDALPLIIDKLLLAHTHTCLLPYCL